MLAAVCGVGIVVVPRKGDVDRNLEMIGFDQADIRSSPARGTWIEMP